MVVGWARTKALRDAAARWEMGSDWRWTRRGRLGIQEMRCRCEWEDCRCRDHSGGGGDERAVWLVEVGYAREARMGQ